MKGFRIDVDLNKRILRLKVWGFWTAQDAQLYHDEFIEKSKPLLSDGWFVLADLSRFGIQHEQVQSVHRDLMRYATENGMLKAANLISTPRESIQIDRLSKEAGIPKHLFFTSEIEAEKWLLE